MEHVEERHHTPQPPQQQQPATVLNPQASQIMSSLGGGGGTGTGAGGATQGASTSTSSSSTNATAATQRYASQIHRAISPPTPAPSPQPYARRPSPSSALPNASSLELLQAGMQGIVTPTHENDNDDASPLLRYFTQEFPLLNSKDRYAFLAHFVDLCSARELAHLSSLISPRLKVDFLSALPIEVSLTILSHLDDPRTLARASCVSRFWRSLVNDEQTWKVMCKRYRFRQVPLFPSASRSQALGLETPDQTMEPLTADSELSASEQQHDGVGASMSSLESSEVLGSLFEAYRARGLDPSTALSELKALHELFLSKRAREMGVEERRRQLHALQNDNVFMDLMQDKTFVTRIAETSMSEDDKRFYGQLEEFVREKQAELGAEGSSSADTRRGSSSSSSRTAAMTSTNDITSPDMREATAVGWLSTGPPSTRTMAGPEDDPRTPVVPPTSGYFGAGTALPLRGVGRTIVSPTSRLGSMTSGLLTSLWDRTAGGPGPSSATLDVRDAQAPSQPPSSGDHGHSTEGHQDEDWDSVTHTDAEVRQNDQSQQSEGMQLDEPTTERRGPLESALSASTSASSTDQTSTTSSQPRRVQTRKASRRFAPFTRPGDESTGEHSLGLGRPSTLQSQDAGSAIRAVTSWGGGGALGLERVEGDTTFTTGSVPPAKRAISMGQPSIARSSSSNLTGSRHSKPFSYKTHFKLAYQTESNWLRGGRLLTQHVSSDDASGEGATVTSLSIDDQWIIVGMANAKIHAFDARTGLFVRTLTGHTAGVWCLALISASSNGKSTTTDSKGKSRTEGEDAVERAKTIGAYPYDNDRPLYTPTPDLNLTHHDPRPAASVFSPELRYAELAGDEGGYSMPEPLQTGPQWVQQRGNQRSLHDTLHSSRSLTPQAEPISAVNSASFQTPSPPPPRAAFEAAAAARATAGNAAGGSGGGRASGSGGAYTSRGAGLGSNFGSPCGSVAGYGNEHAIVVSSGCDRDVRVWDLNTGECKYVLSGHRSTVRCLRVFEGRPIAISGSRDGTMRVWNVETGQLQHLLPGHQHSVRCLDLAGNLVASASYDCTARIWNVDTGKCLHVLRGHYHQLYAVAFDGVHVATGSLDTTVRIWSAETGECLALLQGHTSLVGQLQLTDSTLITGGSDGKVMVFSLKTMKQLYQLSAHDNSVTCLQFDDRFIVTGGNDGKVKLWNFRTGEYVRELCESSDQVWKVSFRDDKCVVLCKRDDKTSMDVISFRPIEEGI